MLKTRLLQGCLSSYCPASITSTSFLTRWLCVKWCRCTSPNFITSLYCVQPRLSVLAWIQGLLCQTTTFQVLPTWHVVEMKTRSVVLPFSEYEIASKSLLGITGFLSIHTVWLARLVQRTLCTCSMKVKRAKYRGEVDHSRLNSLLPGLPT